ncbi:5'-nucleotidase C-terminal domain-containing protein [Haliovirga abyssi]|uniref:Multifunctional 2',3'-cyclic-nucleotide 2'-phosphodiesterase/5'-nucleotidase/3'-nucleotidase n=1 Tax=Haliovirga abyssi TaxID=2996794 RepID=A0AAU9DFP2_9FUSO|nr:5'-nucleotidase C-terminal domain-containing protein [Haliovirga abyssi]BDU50212.1 multifunctional 2',3'-cyclic-nucleotide 2'-phosphodiesterase/5'-nucleotidase/3'-nucleotidase [Haliovirga abyssi]
MIRILKTLLLFFLLIVSLVGCGGTKEKKVAVIFTSSIEGRIDGINTDKGKFGGIVNIAEEIRIKRKELEENGYKVLLMDTGNSLSGTYYGSGDNIYNIYEKIGYQVIGIGARELELGIDKVGEFNKKGKLKFVLTNISEIDKYANEEVTIKINDVKISILNFIDYESQNNYKRELKGLKAYSAIGEVALKKVDDVSKKSDVVLVINNGTPVMKYKYLNTNIKNLINISRHDFKNRNIYNLKRYGQELGVITFAYNRNGKIIKNFKIEKFPITEMKINNAKDIEKLLEYEKQSKQQEGETVLGKSNIILDRDNSYKEESPITNFVCDVLYEKYKNKGVKFVLINNGSVRKPLLKGNITKKDIFNVIPFFNYSTILDLKGKDIQRILEKQNEFYGRIRMQSNLGVIQKISKNKLEVYLNGKKLEDEKYYRILTTNYLANGGDDCTEFANKINTEYGNLLREDVEEYVRKKKIIDYKFKKRILKLGGQND